MKRIITMLLVVMLSGVMAQDNENQRKAIYLQPFSLISSLAISDKIEYPLILYIAGEIPFNGSTSLIVAPSLWTGDVGDDDINIFRLGTGVGIRHFPNGESDGLYLQAMPSFHYLSVEETHTKGRETVSGFMVDILGYVGFAAKYSHLNVYVDVGVGYGRFSLDAKSDIDILLDGLTYDFNFGIGIPF